MVSRSIHSAMMIYSAHKHTQRERQADADTQPDMHTQTAHTHAVCTVDAEIKHTLK